MAEELFYVPTPTNLVVEKYPKIPSPLCEKGTKEQWDEFWLKRDAFLFGCKLSPAAGTTVELRELFDSVPRTERNSEENNLLFEQVVSRPRYVNCQTTTRSV